MLIQWSHYLCNVYGSTNDVRSFIWGLSGDNNNVFFSHRFHTTVFMCCRGMSRSFMRDRLIGANDKSDMDFSMVKFIHQNSGVFIHKSTDGEPGNGFVRADGNDNV